jgi:secreted trypsin-like serine protease
MLYSLLRGLKVRQVGQISLNISVNGTAGTPVASGPDAAFVSSIVDNGTGDYTIILKESAKMNLHVSSLVLATADSSIIPFAVAKNSVQVKAKSVAASPAAKDVDFSIQIQYFDQLSYFF